MPKKKEFFEIKIKVKPHVAKFLNQLEPSPNEFSERTLVGKTFINFLLSQRHFNELKLDPKTYSSTYIVKLPRWYFTERGYPAYMTQRSMMDFGQVFETWYRFIEQFGVKCMTEYHPRQNKQAFEHINQMFKVTEFDQSGDAQTKAYYRFKNDSRRMPFPVLNMKPVVVDSLN